MKSLWQAFWSDESGQGLVEYALIIALVAVGLIAILLVLRNSIGNVFNNAATQLNNAPATPYRGCGDGRDLGLATTTAPGGGATSGPALRAVS